MLNYKTLIGAVSASVFAFAAVPATAADFDIEFGPDYTVDPGDGGGDATFSTTGDPFDGPVTGNFTRSGILDGTWTDRFIFQIGQEGVGGGSVTTTAAFDDGLTDLDFISASFFNGVETFFFDVDSDGLVEEFGGSGIPIFFGKTNVLTIEYSSNGFGSYSGDLAFEPNAVPEPGTWGLMLLGFAGIGMAMRRRRKETVRVKYAF